MSLNQVSEVCAKMNDTTEEFLKELSSKLNRVFSAEDTENYLLGMVDHLKTYYRDVFNELEKKHADIALEIEGTFQNSHKKENFNIVRLFTCNLYFLQINRIAQRA